MYIEVLILLNFSVDFLLLLATNRLCGYPCELKRTTLSALLGGVYGGICILPGLIWLSGVMGRFICLMTMSGIAFGFSRESFRRTILFVFLTMALGGIAMVLGGSGFWMVILYAIGVVLMCTLGIKGRVGTQYASVAIVVEQGTVRFLALRDTGNTLVDPITGQQILVASVGLAAKLLGVTKADLEDPVSTVRNGSGMRLVPYHSVGKEGGLLLAKKFDDVTIGTTRGSCLVAFAPHELGEGEPYDALIGGL